MIVDFLSEEDAKTRKNTALLIGDLKLEQAKEALIAAYLNETTLYVKSAYLTALGKLDVTENLEFFKKRLGRRLLGLQFNASLIDDISS